MIYVIHRIIIFSNYFFLWYLVVYASYILLCAVSGSVKMYGNRKKEILQNILEHEFYYPISILVPAYNESISVILTIKSLLQLDYKLYEIVVIDDGSTDDTKQLVIDEYGLVKEEGRPIRYEVPCQPINEIYTGMVDGIRIVLISKVNGRCKADAINAGINVGEYPYVVNMDADEILQRDALKIASRALLEDDDVIAVGGNIKMSNCVTFSNAMPVETELGKNMIVDMQVIEYGRAFVGSRIFQNELNMNLIVSGGFGVFKKSVLIEVGGYDKDSMGEDMEITVRMHKHFRDQKKPYSIKYIPDSVCWTQGPENMSDLKKQRQRWYCGLIQTIGKYKSMIFNPRYGAIGLFMIPYMIMYELLKPMLMIIGWFVIGWTLFDNSINFPYVLYVYIIYFAFGVLLSLVSFLDKIYMNKDKIGIKKIFVALYTTIVDAIFFRMYLSIISCLALFKMNKLRKKWESPKRVVVKTND